MLHAYNRFKEFKGWQLVILKSGPKIKIFIPQWDKGTS